MEWEQHPEGLVNDVGGYRLLVQVANGQARFFVLRHPREAGRHPYAVLACGGADRAEDAMQAAERVATRMMASLSGRNVRSAA
jgi:hypothetical protein